MSSIFVYPGCPPPRIRCLVVITVAEVHITPLFKDFYIIGLRKMQFLPLGKRRRKLYLMHIKQAVVGDYELD